MPIRIRDYEKYLNVLWALIALSLAYETFREILLIPELSLIVWFLLHCIAALLFFIRSKPIRYSSSILAYCVALASVNYYLLYTPLPAPGLPLIGKTLTFLGGMMGIVSTLSLGKCFGILPVYRGVQTSAAYRFVRHPIYASYILLDSGIVITYPSWENFLVFCMAILLFVLRIRYEEDVLQQADAYLAYQQKVKFKLIPLVY